MVTKAANRDKQIKHILIAILLLNWAVALAKIIYGLVSHCASMTADGFHSFSDGFSNVIGLIGVSIASHDKDRDHPYGHKKYETFSSLGIAALLIIVCLNLIKEGVQRLHNPYPLKATGISFAMMIVTLGINLLVTNYEHRKGEFLQSDILISDAMHTKTDIFTSLSVIIALTATKLGYPILDPVATIIIAVFIAYSAIGIIKQSSRILCDSAAIVDIKKITDVVLGIRGVKACHKIRTRGRPDDIYIDFHVQVSKDMHINKAHKICYTIEEQIKKDIPGVTDVVVHVEPEEKD